MKKKDTPAAAPDFKAVPMCELHLSVQGGHAVHVSEYTIIQRYRRKYPIGILAEMYDISRFDDVKEIQKLSGMSLVACSSGTHNGQTNISRRGRIRLRYWLFQTEKPTVFHTDRFKQ